MSATCAHCPKCGRLIALEAGRFVRHTTRVVRANYRLTVTCHGSQTKVPRAACAEPYLTTRYGRAGSAAMVTLGNEQYARMIAAGLPENGGDK